MSQVGFSNISSVLGCGVYILRLRGRVAFVGKARKCMLGRIATHRALANKSVPSWSPLHGVIFDSIEVRAVHPDQLDDIYESLYAELMHRPQFSPTSFPPLRARALS